jgi:Holliday junction resolvase RusA-like endonuclease
MSKPILSLTVDGPPQSQPRPRVTQHGTYMPQPYKSYKEVVAWSVRVALGPYEPDATGRYRLHLTFHLQPQKTTKRMRRQDIEKLAGTIMDALEGILYHNDEQVDSLAVEKLAGRPRVQIEAWRMP